MHVQKTVVGGQATLAINQHIHSNYLSLHYNYTMVGGHYELVAMGNPLLDMQVRDGQDVLSKVRMYTLSVFLR